MEINKEIIRLREEIEKREKRQERSIELENKLYGLNAIKYIQYYYVEPEEYKRRVQDIIDSREMMRDYKKEQLKKSKYKTKYEY